MLPTVLVLCWLKKVILMLRRIYLHRSVKATHQFISSSGVSCLHKHCVRSIGARSSIWKCFCSDARCLGKSGTCLFCSRSFCLGCENGKYITQVFFSVQLTLLCILVDMLFCSIKTACGSSIMTQIHKFSYI